MAALLSDKMITFLNFRIEQEELSARLYLSMSNWLNMNGFVGASKLWKKYSDEEYVHASFTYEYLLAMNILPTVPALTAVPNTFPGGFVQIINDSKAHEEVITKQCKELAKACLAEGDYNTLTLAQKYNAEQIEELAKTQLHVDQLASFGTDKLALRMLDNYMLESLV